MFPAGRPVRSAVRDVIASPSGSVAVTDTVRSDASATLALDGAVTVGALPPMLKVSRTLPRGQPTSFVPPPAGPHRNEPSMPVDVKCSFSEPRCIALNTDHEGWVQASQRQLPSCSKLLPPVPAVMCTTPFCGKLRS